jgi:hypothetical protein
LFDEQLVLPVEAIPGGQYEAYETQSAPAVLSGPPEHPPK